MKFQLLQDGLSRIIYSLSAGCQADCASLKDRERGLSRLRGVKRRSWYCCHRGAGYPVNVRSSCETLS